MKICLVTEELPTLGPSGGIGTAFQELATTLAANGHKVDILYMGVPGKQDLVEATRRFAGHGVTLHCIDVSIYAWEHHSATAKSFAAYRYLSSLDDDYDAIHFHDYRGTAFYTLQAKRLSARFEASRIVIQTHGPIRWALAANQASVNLPDHLIIDFMEKACLRHADHVVSPSAFLVEWMRENGMLEDRPGVSVIPNLATIDPSRHRSHSGPVTEIIMFGRHEFRKGLATFCDAIDRLAGMIESNAIKVTFLGQPSELNGTPSEIYLTQRGRKWNFPIGILPNLGRDEALSYLADAANGAVVVVPSREENSPYTVLETLIQGIPVVTSSRGGAKELVAPELHDRFLYDGSPKDLSRALRDLIENGAPAGKPAFSNEDTVARWLSFHDGLAEADGAPETPRPFGDNPRVVFGITHYERPDKLMAAIQSALEQTYQNMEIVVYDDGSTSPEARSGLTRAERLLARFGGRVIRGENRYLGAARNTIARETESDLIVFLDDDDIALPSMVEILVEAAQRAPDAIVAPFNRYMPEARRGEAMRSPEHFEGKLSHAFTGGPLSYAAYGNTLSAATAMFPRKVFEKLGGYSEAYGVGLEDMELYIRALQENIAVEIYPEELYLYEVDRVSMISSTPAMANVTRLMKAIDLSKSPSAWKDLIACATAQTNVLSARNRARYLERISPHHHLLEAIRKAPVNSAKRFDLLTELASRTGAEAMASAWSLAGAKQLKAVPVDHGATSGANGPLEPYQPFGYGFALAFQAGSAEVSCESTGNRCDVTVASIGDSSWLSLEAQLDPRELASQDSLTLLLDISASKPIVGQAIIRVVSRGYETDTDMVPFSPNPHRPTMLHLALPEALGRLCRNAISASVILFLPSEPIQLTMRGVKTSVAFGTPQNPGRRTCFSSIKNFIPSRRSIVSVRSLLSAR